MSALASLWARLSAASMVAAARLGTTAVRRRAVAALAEQSTYSGLQGAALFVGLTESRFTAIAGALVFVFGLVKVMMPDPGPAVDDAR